MLRSHLAVVSAPAGTPRTTRRRALARLALPAGAVAGLPLLAACAGPGRDGGAPSGAQGPRARRRSTSSPATSRSRTG